MMLSFEAEKSQDLVKKKKKKKKRGKSRNASRTGANIYFSLGALSNAVVS